MEKGWGFRREDGDAKMKVWMYGERMGCEERKVVGLVSEEWCGEEGGVWEKKMEVRGDRRGCEGQDGSVRRRDEGVGG